MLIWLKRWLAYLLISGGLVLLFIPLCTHRMEYIEKNFLFLENIGNLIASEKSAKTETTPLPKPNSLEEKRQQVNEKRMQKAKEDTLASTIINPYGYPKIQYEDLTHYSLLSKEISTIQRMGTDNIRLIRLDSVPLKEWNSFREAFGISEKDSAFQYGKYIFKGYVKASCISVPVEVKNLKTWCKVVGIIFLVLGISLLYKSYAPPTGGIRVGRRSAIIIWDVIIILISIPFAWWFIDLILVQVFQTVPEWKEYITWGMGVFWVVIAYPLLALITTATSIQTLWITSNTIVLKGLFNMTKVLWPDVESICVSQAYSPRKIGSVPAPHRVMKILEIRTGASTLRVLEPPYTSTKKEIIDMLMKHAPEKIKASITIVSKEWLSKW